MLRVVKLGGSLLSHSDTKKQLQNWLEQQPTCKTILIAGGGDLVDCVREWDRVQSLDEAACHRLAMACMSVTIKLVAEWLPRAILLEDLDHVFDSADELILFDTRKWVLANDLLPETWQLTSDSISAAVAVELDADELVLLKSCLPTESEGDFCDSLFSQFATTSTIRVVNLQSTNLVEVVYQP